MLFVTWPEQMFRPTGDLDLLGHGPSDPEAITHLFQQICQVEYLTDGIVYDAARIRVDTVREDDEYQGVRVTLRAFIGKTEIPVQVDIGFGDHVYPSPGQREFPVMLDDLPAPTILMYPPETVIAEKLEAAIRFGETNGRIKDFYDLWVISRTFRFDLATLAEAIRGTLARRGTDIPGAVPVALALEFADSPDRQKLWAGFLRRNPPSVPPPSFATLMVDLRRFLLPVLSVAMRPDSTGTAQWNPDSGSWSSGP